MADVKTTLDISDVVAKSAQLDAILKAQAASFSAVNKAQLEFNAQGGVTGATIESINSKGQKLVSTVESVGKMIDWTTGRIVDKLEVVSSKIDYTGSQAQKAFEKMSRSATGEAGINRITAAWDRAANVATRFAQYKLLNFTTGETGDAIRSARDYQTQISLIRTISQEAQLSTGQWANGISDLSGKLGIEFKDVASAAYDAVSNQIAQGANTFRFLENAGNLARVTGSSLKDSGNILANIINTFGASAGSQEAVVAKLFTLQDRGRIVLSEIANTYGRVAFTAEAAGVSMDEVNGAIALMTRSGVTGDDAITLLNNVMTHFLKPSEEMKKHLDSIGIGATANVFKIHGLTGAIQIMQDVVKNGGGDLQKLFPDIRANRAAGFLLNRTGELQNEINIAGSSSTEERMRKALEITTESNADKLNKTLITFQNSLTQKVGNGINSLLAKGIDRVGAAANAYNRDGGSGVLGQMIGGVDTKDAVDNQEKLKKAIDDTIDTIIKGAKVVGTLIVGYNGFRLAVGAARIATELSTFSAQKKLAIDELLRAKASQNIAMTRAEAAEQIRLGRARQFAAGGSVAALGGPIGAAILAGTVIASYVAFKEVSTDAFESASDAIKEYNKNLDKLEIDKKFTKNVEGAKVFAEVLEKINRDALKGMTDKLSEANKELDEMKSKVNDSGGVIKNKMVAYFDLVRNSIQRADEEVKKLQTRLDGAGKFKGSLSDKIFDATEKFAEKKNSRMGEQGEIANINLIENKVKATQQKIAMLYKKGDADSIQEARKLSEQLIDLISNRYSRIDDLEAKRQADAAANPGGLQGAGGGVSADDLNRDLKKNEAWIASLEDSTAAADKARIATLQLDIAKKKALEDKTKTAAKEFENFSAFDKGGNIKKEFKSGSQFDLAKFKAEFEKAKAALDATIDPEALKQLDGKGGLSLSDSMQDHAKNMGQMIAAMEKQKMMKDAQAEGVKAFEDTTKAQNMTADSLSKLMEKQDAFIAKSKAVAEAQEKVNNGIGDLINKSVNESKGSQSGGAAGRGAAMALEWAGLTNDYAPASTGESKAKEQIAAVIKRINDAKGKTVTKFGKVLPDISETRGIQQDLKAVKESVTSNIDQLTGDRSGNISQDLANKIDAKIKQLKEVLQTFQSLEADAALIEKEQAANEKLYELSSNAEKLAADVKSADSAVMALVGGVGVVSENSKTEVDKLREAIKLLNEEAAKRPSGSALPEPKRQAYGGPVGSDNQMIYAKAGEIVSTQEASNSFYSQIMAMNATSRTPQYFSGGGQVGGPVTVNVNESKTPRMTGREVERVFKRHQRQQGNRR